MFPSAAWSDFMGARQILLQSVDEEWSTKKYRPLATVLGAYYLHGL
jgi:hypothetical protein